jgi:predicted DNA-binding transcriptional regulator YafY
MRRADRLFQIIQILRRSRRPMTAKTLAEELGTSLRSVYRDVAELMAQRIPIRGEAGIGYVLSAEFDMPPLMLTADEVEAAVLGAQWVAARADPALARSARDLIAKVEAVLPRRLRHLILESSVIAALEPVPDRDGLDMGRVRQWIREGRKIHIEYEDEKGRLSKRTIWPVAAAYFDSMRLVCAWCESRNGFRHFRADRVRNATFLPDRVPQSTSQLLQAWRAAEKASNRGRGRQSDGGQ